MVWLRSLALLVVLGGASWVHSPDSARAAEPFENQPLDLAGGFAVLHDMLTLAESYAYEHLDVDGRYHADSGEGASWGRMHLRFYPQGRTQADHAIEADTWIKSQDGSWSFQFQLKEASPTMPDLDL